MEVNFETLRQCNNCRFEAECVASPVHGIVHVRGGKDIYLFFNWKDEDTDWFLNSTNLGYEHSVRIPKGAFERKFPEAFINFKITPRDPETYKDWQVGDRVAMPDSDNDNNYVIVIFRAGELVIFKRPMSDGSWTAYSSYTCEELFKKGWRLVLTDIEKEIIEEEKAAEDISRFRAFKRLAPVLVRDRDASTWKAAVLDRVEPEQDYPFLMLSETRWKQCAPLNEETVGYLGTTQKIPNQCGKE